MLCTWKEVGGETVEEGEEETARTERRRKRREESLLLGASAWISVGISVATLFYARDTFGRRGEE